MFQEQKYYSLLVSAIWVSCDKLDNLSMAMGHVLLWPSSFDLVSTSGVFTQTPSSSYSKYYILEDRVKWVHEYYSCVTVH